MTIKTRSLAGLIFLLMLLLYACGGAIGNIEKYTFDNIPVATLKAAVERVNVKHPEFRQFDKKKYREGVSQFGDGNYYCTIVDDNQKYLFCYAYSQYPKPYDKITEIALTTAAPYGNNLLLDKDIGFFEKRKYRKLFEKTFIAAVKKEKAQ